MGASAGNGIKKVLVGQDGIMATPAMSALIRRRKLYGGLIMSASHNPAGPKEVRFLWHDVLLPHAGLQSWLTVCLKLDA